MKILLFLVMSLTLGPFLPALASSRDVAQFPSCALCGMSRDKFAHSRGLVGWDDGSSTAVCSLNCVAATMSQETAKKVKSVAIADHDSLDLLPAGQAFWVVGGAEKGVMTPEPKWAFGKKENAEKFIGRSGGTMTTYDDALKRAQSDIKMRRRTGSSK